MKFVFLMEKQNMRRLILPALVASLAGCATLTTGTTQSLTVLTPEMQGADCELTDSKGMKWYVKDTPDTVVVSRGDGPLLVACEKEGFHPAMASIEEEFQGATLGNVLLGGGIGVIVDATSGAAQRYPDQITMWLEPKSFGTEAERERWQGLKLAWEEEQAAIEAARNQPSNVAQQRRAAQ